ncbi:hypothetical protein DITRI_Ditri02bG0120000 [Diplodiscus trichospermus]
MSLILSPSSHKIYLPTLSQPCHLSTRPVTRISCLSTPPRKKTTSAKSEEAEARELVRIIMRIFSDKESLVKTLNRYVKVVRFIMGKKGQTGMAMWLFSEMRNSGCRPDASVYNALITAHLHSRDKAKALDKALGYFNKMKGMERCKPNIVTYNILLRAFAQARNVDQVNALFKDLTEHYCP